MRAYADRQVKRRYVLATPVECRMCRKRADRVVVIPAGPHKKACCQFCGAYLKFLKAGEGAPLRNPGEERTGNNRRFWIVSAIRDSVCKPTLTTYSSVAAEAERARIKRLGYLAVVDEIPASEHAEVF